MSGRKTCDCTGISRDLVSPGNASTSSTFSSASRILPRTHPHGDWLFRRDPSLVRRHTNKSPLHPRPDLLNPLESTTAETHVCPLPGLAGAACRESPAGDEMHLGKHHFTSTDLWSERSFTPLISPSCRPSIGGPEGPRRVSSRSFRRKLTRMNICPLTRSSLENQTEEKPTGPVPLTWALSFLESKNTWRFQKDSFGSL